MPSARRDPPFILALGLRGGSSFSHVNLLRGDVAPRSIPGLKWLPGDDATRAFFGRFGWKEVDAFFPALTAWLLARQPAREGDARPGLYGFRALRPTAGWGEEGLQSAQARPPLASSADRRAGRVDVYSARLAALG
jgi:hypothetical protein